MTNLNCLFKKQSNVFCIIALNTMIFAITNKVQGNLILLKTNLMFHILINITILRFVDISAFGYENGGRLKFLLG